MTTTVSTIFHKFHNARRFTESVANTEMLYLFAGDFSLHANNQLQPIYESPSNTMIGAYKSMILGKAIANTDLAYAINYNPWVANTVYNMYDDQDGSLSTEAFHVITNEGSFFHYWKVLDNNQGIASTIQPQFAYVSGSNTVSFQTSDGYRWKYMTSVSSASISKFQVGSTLVPVIANNTVSAAAVPGSLDVIKIDFFDGGRGYNNFTNGTLRSTDIYPSGNRLQFNISNNAINTTNGYYTGCLFVMTSGVCKGLYRTVTNFVSNSSGSIVQLDSQLTFDPVNGDSFEINPQVAVIGDGQQTINCTARALVNALAGNAVYRVEVLQPGANHRTATASVTANAIVGVSNTANLRPIMPPQGGHGFHVYTELYSHSVIISSFFNGTESGTLPDVNIFQQYGILRNPTFANVSVLLNPSVGTFAQGETVLQVIPKKINANGTVIAGNNFLSCNTAEFTTQVAIGDRIYFQTPDNISLQIATVNSITNSSTIILTSNANFGCTSVNIYAMNVISTATVLAVPGTANTVYLTNASLKLQLFSSILLGNTSGARGILQSTTISGVAKNMTVFIEMYKYVATTVNGVFTQGEVLVQGNNSANLHSVSGSGTVTLYAAGSPFTVGGGNIVGQTSGAIATPTAAYPPELSFQSGQVQYIENILPVTRQGGQVETIQLVLNY
jgi:hypothetical protein